MSQTGQPCLLVSDGKGRAGGLSHTVSQQVEVGQGTSCAETQTLGQTTYQRHAPVTERAPLGLAITGLLLLSWCL